MLRVLLSITLIVAVYTHQDSSEGRQQHIDDHEEGNDFSNIWAVQILDGADPDEIAKLNGFKNNGAINAKQGYYEFVRVSNRRIKRNSGHEERIHHSLSEHPQVLWLKRQRYLSRVKRCFNEQFNDPLLEQQWYICNNGKNNGGLKGFDLNIEPVWKMGYTGKGVKVSVLDDGMDHTHPDLKANYDPQASWDLNGNDADPFPRDSDPYNAHGTKCCGEIAASADNGVCGAGVAYNASIGAVRMLDGRATDSLEAKALGFRNDYIDIYSCSWGPKDDGKTFGRPGTLGARAFITGAQEGRQGKGNIYVWATGNGGLVGDNCGCDGYTNSIYTMSVGSVSDHGTSTFYDEMCSSTMAVVYTADSHSEMRPSSDKLITTGLHHTCEVRFSGTSSAAPLAAGIVALLLEANPDLTWRDVQHIVVRTAKKTSPLESEWKTNGAGLQFNHKFGFGLLDAHAMVKLGLEWKPVAVQHTCEGKKGTDGETVTYRGAMHIDVHVDACQDDVEKRIDRLEHVEVTMTIHHHRRGDLRVSLVSPSGTPSVLLAPRPRDDSNQGLNAWTFMSVHFWGEKPVGTWRLTVSDESANQQKRGKDMEAVYGELLDRKKDKRARDFIPGEYETPHDEIHHGRFKEDYMRDEIPKEISEEPWEFSETQHKKDNVFVRNVTPVGRVINWQIKLYGTASE